jgi:hypothetical protein
MTYTRKDVDIQKRQLEDLIASKNAKIIENGRISDSSVDKVYQSICDRVLTINKR